MFTALGQLPWPSGPHVAEKNNRLKQNNPQSYSYRKFLDDRGIETGQRWEANRTLTARERGVSAFPRDPTHEKVLSGRIKSPPSFATTGRLRLWIIRKCGDLTVQAIRLPKKCTSPITVAMSICRTVYAIPSLTSTNSSVDYWRLRGGRKTIASSSCSKGGRNGDNKKQAEQGKPNSSRGRKSAKRLREQGGVRLLY